MRKIRPERKTGAEFELVLAAMFGALALVALASVVAVDRWTDESVRGMWYLVSGGIPGALAALFLVRFFGYTYLSWSLTDNDGVRIDVDGLPPSVAKTAFRECEAMAEYALSSGKEVPPAVLQTIAGLTAKFPRPLLEGAKADYESPTVTMDDVHELAVAHSLLTRLVAPATPRTLNLISQGSTNRVLRFLGSIRLVRYFEYLAAGLLALFIAMAFKADFTTSGEAFQATGSTKIYNAFYLLAAAGLGACFFGLYKANRFIIRGTYDQKYEATYWVRFTLGIVAGVVLAMVIPIGELNSSNTSDPQSSALFTKPLLALLGGFSADVVYRIMARLVETLEALIQGRSDDLITAQAEASAAREAIRVAQARNELSAELVRLDAALEAGVTNEEARSKIRDLLEQMLPAVTTSIDPAGTPIAPVRKAAKRRAAQR